MLASTHTEELADGSSMSNIYLLISAVHHLLGMSLITIVFIVLICGVVL